MIVLSDGVDDDGRGRQLSKRDLDEPLMLGIQTNIPIYTIGLGSKMDAGILRTFAGTTGAEYVNAPTKEELEELYTRIGRTLSNQYAIEYTSSEPLNNGVREVKLDYVVPSRKPYAAPRPVMGENGQVLSYQAPILDDEALGRLARLAGVDDYARSNQIKPLEKFIQELPKQWPEVIPVYPSATGIELEEKEETSVCRFESAEEVDSFVVSYGQILKDGEWNLYSQSKAGEVSMIKAVKGQSEMTVGIEAKGDDSLVNIEYSVPTDKPIIITKDEVNQIIAAEGRDVIVSGSDGVIIVSGGCGTLTIEGQRNRLQCDRVQEIRITGNQNQVISGAVGQGDVSGNDNRVSWGSGFDGRDAEFEATGEGNSISRLE